MDGATALVRAYLQINGYFTVTEYPIVEVMPDEQLRTVTDIDVIAFRFPRAGRLIPEKGRPPKTEMMPIDDILGSSSNQGDMIIGEIKEGRARFNPRMFETEVLQTALMRFGCCSIDHTKHIVKHLLDEGYADLPVGHRVRMMMFGSERDTGSSAYPFVPLSHVMKYLTRYIREHWDLVKGANFRDEALNFLVTMEKARKGR